jgi:hypothetical protein
MGASMADRWNLEPYPNNPIPDSMVPHFHYNDNNDGSDCFVLPLGVDPEETRLKRFIWKPYLHCISLALRRLEFSSKGFLSFCSTFIHHFSTSQARMFSF